jgi:uncharacterized membrane protein YbhN (UPF0104 family)
VAFRRAAAATTTVGIAIAVAGFAFVVKKAADHWDEVHAGLEHGTRAWFVVGFLLATAGMVTMAAMWRYVIEALGGDVSVRDALRWFFPGELGKYVPGGIWSVVGRAELAFRAGVRRSIAYASVALSLGANYLAAVAVITVAVPIQLALTSTSKTALLLMLLLPVGVASLHPRVVHAALGLAHRVLRREVALEVPAWGTSLRLIARYVPVWLCIGTATWAVARALDSSAPFGRVFVAAVVSWVVGFILVPVPSGVGVREAAFVAAAGLPSGVGATAAIVARVMFMALDASGAAIAPVLARRRERLPTGASRD